MRAFPLRVQQSLLRSGRPGLCARPGLLGRARCPTFQPQLACGHPLYARVRHCADAADTPEKRISSLQAFADRIIEDPDYAKEVAALPETAALLQKAPSVGDGPSGKLVGGCTLPSQSQMRLYALHNFIPFIGFGFFDNFIMIIAGDFIDVKLGSIICVSTLCAAGIGNTISDAFGLWISGFIETAMVGWGVEAHGLTSRQMSDIRMLILKNTSMLCGMCLGCVIGMFPLVFPEQWRLW